MLKVGRKGPDHVLQQRIWDARDEGLADGRIGLRLGLSCKQVKWFLLKEGGIKPRRPRRRSERHLSAAEREEISRGLARGDSYRRIGARIGRHHTTISREVIRSGNRRCRYRATAAEEAAWERQRRPKSSKLGQSPELCALVKERLELEHSPEQIAGWLKLSFPDNPDMQVSHEAIYRSLFLQTRGELKRELCRYLRSGRKRRKAKNAERTDLRGKIPEMVSISERPAEAADRAVPGHWEGDLIMGTGHSAIATLVERTTRYCQLVALPAGHRADQVAEALAASIGTLPAQLRRSLTWDQGSEMTEHRKVTVQAGLPVYFCDPSSPWQRGSNENTNGLLRQYFPKRTNLAKVTQQELDEVAQRLNTRPRKTLGFMTPAQKLQEVLGADRPAG